MAENVIPVKGYSDNWKNDKLRNVDRNSYITNAPEQYQITYKNAEINDVTLEPNSVSFNINTDGLTFVNHAQLYYKGWNVYVDGQKSNLYLVNNLIQGVYVSAGNHHVEFRYEPVDMLIGAVLSFLGVMLSIIILIRFGNRNCIKYL